MNEQQQSQPKKRGRKPLNLTEEEKAKKLAEYRAKRRQQMAEYNAKLESEGKIQKNIRVRKPTPSMVEEGYTDCMLIYVDRASRATRKSEIAVWYGRVEKVRVINEETGDEGEPEYKMVVDWASDGLEHIVKPESRQYRKAKKGDKR